MLLRWTRVADFVPSCAAVLLGSDPRKLVLWLERKPDLFYANVAVLQRIQSGFDLAPVSVRVLGSSSKKKKYGMPSEKTVEG